MQPPAPAVSWAPWLMPDVRRHSFLRHVVPLLHAAVSRTISGLRLCRAIEIFDLFATGLAVETRGLPHFTRRMESQ